MNGFSHTEMSKRMDPSSTIITLTLYPFSTTPCTTASYHCPSPIHFACRVWEVYVVWWG